MRAILLLAILFITGCTQTTSAPPAVSVAPAPGQAAVTITRSGSLLYAGAPASVDLNGARVASLGVGQSWSGSVPPGNAVITVSAWSSPGVASVQFQAE